MTVSIAKQLFKRYDPQEVLLAGKYQLFSPWEQVLRANDMIRRFGWNMQPIDISLPLPKEEICREGEYLFLNFVMSDSYGRVSLKETFDGLWSAINFPGYAKIRTRNIEIGNKRMKTINGFADCSPGVRWGIIRPYANYKRKIDKIWQGQVDDNRTGKFKLAGTELLSAILMQPDVFKNIEKPINMTSLCITNRHDCPIFAPSIHFCDHKIILDAYWSDAIGGCYSPICKLF